MNQPLAGKKLLVLVANGVEESAMSHVQRDLLKTGAAVKTVGIAPGLVNSWNSATNGWGLYFPVDQQASQTLGSDYDCLVVPAGARGALKLAASPHSERILSSFLEAGKPVALMGDAVELLAKTGLARGWTVAGPEACHQVMTAAGAAWAGNDVHFHNILMTGVCEDAPAFISVMTAHFAGGGAEQQVKAAA